MTVKKAIEERRAFRALVADPVSDEVVRELASAARLAPSANDHQPWRLVFARRPDVFEACRTEEVFPSFNEWVYRAAMLVAVCGREGDDDVVPVVHRSYAGHHGRTSQRPLFLFDLGSASAFMMLRATELGLVAHPIAGYDEPKVKKVLAIPDEYDVVAMLVVGTKTYDQDAVDSLPPDLQPDELRRPARLELGELAFADRFGTSIPTT